MTEVPKGTPEAPKPASQAPETPKTPENANSEAARIDGQRRTQGIRDNVEKGSGDAKYEFVFEGVNSDITKVAQAYIAETIDKTFEKVPAYGKLSSQQKENIKIGTLDRILRLNLGNKGIFSLLGESLLGKSKKWVDAFREASKSGNWGELLNGAKKESDNAGKGGDTNGKKEASSLEDLAEKLKMVIETAVTPIKNLLTPISGDISVGTLALFDNPREIALYESGEVKANITKLSKEEMTNYIVNLNTSIHAIEGKIVGVQNNREMILNFLGAAPGFVSGAIMDAFEKIVSWFPQLGNLLAMIFGKKDFAEFMASNREELVRSRSIRALRKYGIDEKNKPIDAKTSGKIEMLRDTNLANIDRVRLRPFFDTIRKEGVDIEDEKNDFWPIIFSDNSEKEFSCLDSEKKPVVRKFKLEKTIEPKDLQNGFGGLYEKLNKIQSSTVETPQPTPPAPVATGTPAPETNKPEAGVVGAVGAALPAGAGDTKETKDKQKRDRIMEAVRAAKVFPIEVKTPEFTGKIAYDKDNKQLKIGDENFQVTVRTKIFGREIEPEISSMTIREEDYIFTGTYGRMSQEKKLPKTQVSTIIGQLLETGIYTQTDGDSKMEMKRV